MPVVRIGNYQIPGTYAALHGREGGPRKWRSHVCHALWTAIKEAAVPGLEDRESVTFVFDNEWEADEGDAANPKVAYVFLEGFEDREDRPEKLRRQLARAIGKALVEKLAVGWGVEVMPKRYNSEREGATMVGRDDEPA